MNGQRADTLRQRQLALLLRSELLRQRLGMEAQALKVPMAWADRARAGWLWVQAHPQWPLAGAATVALLRPRRALRWGLRLLWAWRGLQRLQQLRKRI